MSTSGISPQLSGSEAALLRQANSDTGTSSKLIKKALESDKNLVNTLLPTPSGGLDIRA